MLRASSLVLGLLASAAVLAAPHAARACGGVFHEEPVPGQPPETITVASQRIAFALSNEQTVLWSQIKYEGNPSDFAWVLPVGPGAVLEESSDAWFEALDAFTSTNVVAPRVSCVSDSGDDGGGFGCGCGALGDAAPGGVPGRDFGTDPGVTVVHQGSVGPYEYVTVQSSSGQAIQQWLADNGYAVPPAVVPALEAYTAQGLDFMAMRLQPGASVQQMTPVRVIAPGGSPIVPMRMMAAGAGETIPVTLYLLGEGRYAPANFPSVSLPGGALTWDFAAEQSNYGDLRAEALAGEGGRGFLTTFAGQKPLTTELQQPGGDVVSMAVAGSPSEQRVSTLVDLYFTQAAVNGGAPGTACDLKSQLRDLGNLEVVTACADGPTLAGKVCDDQESIPAETFACEGFGDIAVALTGMRPDDLWLTRIEAELPLAALTEDLQLEAAPAQEPVESWVRASEVENVPCEGEYYVESDSLALDPERAQSPVLLVLAAGAAGSVIRRRHGRRR